MCACAALLAGAAPGGALAQTASQITPESYAPPVARRDGAVVLPAAGAARVPEGADRIEVTLAGVTVAGLPPGDPALSALRARLTGRRIRVSEIFEAAQELEARHARAGQVLVRVVVPAQRLNDGDTLRLTLVHGFVERVDVRALPPRIRARVAAVTARLAGARDLGQAEIERRLLLAAQAPGTALRTTLAPGREPGGVVLIVEGTHRPVAASLTYDDSLPDALGRDSFGLGFDFNSVLGAGELIYLRANGLPNTTKYSSMLDPAPRNRALAAGVIVPLGTDGWTVTLEGVDSRTSPRAAINAPALASRFRRASLRLRYPWLLTRAATLGVELAFDASDERFGLVRPLDLRFYQDRLRVARWRIDGTMLTRGGGRIAASAAVSLGLDAFGARSAADASPSLPLSRQGSDARFAKLELDYDQAQPIGPLALQARARAQTSFGKPLANAEQTGIAGPGGISPLTSGILQGDDGWVARAELQGRLPLRAPVAIVPYAFVAAGGVRYHRPTLLELPGVDAAAYGMGVRFAAGDHPRLTGAVEWGRAEFHQPIPGTDRVSVSASFHF